jgi:SNF2 family DNA or RNA helicase
MTKTLKLKSKGYLYTCELTEIENKRLKVVMPYQKELKDEIKAMEGARWNPDEKCWTVADSARNWFQFRFLSALEQKDSPYFRYDQPLDKKLKIKRFNRAKLKLIDAYEHQNEMVSHGLIRKQCIIAGEMGTGKTLALIEIMERSGKTNWWYVAPRSVLRAIERELAIWGSTVRPTLMTYEEVGKRMKAWVPGAPAPEGVIFDESSRIKTSTSQRSQAAKGLADGVRADHGDNGYVILASGTPAPKSPADWWHQCEVACPGYLKEGDIYKFRNRLGIIVQKSSIAGGVYPQLVTWRDDVTKCNICGQKSDNPLHVDDPHSPEAAILQDALPPDQKLHSFVASKNEIFTLYQRMQGLVLVKFKKDCLDLPEKQYRIIEVKPTGSVLRVAKLLTNASATVIQGLTLLRELSDGFQYVKVKTGVTECPRCDGRRRVVDPVEIPGSCANCVTIRELDEAGFPSDVTTCPTHLPKYTEGEVDCPHCGGTGSVSKYETTTKQVACPKDDALIDLLDEYGDVGRLVIYGGFTGTIDRIVDVCHKNDWATIRVDQGKWVIQDSKGGKIDFDPLELFQNDTAEHREKFPRVAFVAHPKSGGMGLTLTASPAIVYFSNDFDGEARTQSEDRIHRPGMDLNRGATIIDIFHLPSDRKVLENLKTKRNMELMSLGEIREAMSVSQVVIDAARESLN